VLSFPDVSLLDQENFIIFLTSAGKKELAKAEFAQSSIEIRPPVYFSYLGVFLLALPGTTNSFITNEYAISSGRERRI
jgi:hypothetical protein